MTAFSSTNPSRNRTGRYVGLLKGENFGKTVVEVSEEPT
jgi:hypothetical protein